jgi:predicted glycosyltransferase
MKIWIDLDNTPHVPFFKPIIRELERRGFKVVITARDAYQVYELADKMNLQYIKIGRHYGKSAVKKLLGLV